MRRGSILKGCNWPPRIYKRSGRARGEMLSKSISEDVEVGFTGLALYEVNAFLGYPIASPVRDSL